MDAVNLGFVAFFVGILLSFGLPYLNVWLTSDEKFNVKKIASEVIGGLVTGLFIISAPGFVDQLQSIASTYDYTSLYFISVMLMSMGGGFSGNMVEKLSKAGYNKLKD